MRDMIDANLQKISFKINRSVVIFVYIISFPNIENKFHFIFCERPHSNFLLSIFILNFTFYITLFLRIINKLFVRIIIVKKRLLINVSQDLCTVL